MFSIFIVSSTQSQESRSLISSIEAVKNRDDSKFHSEIGVKSDRNSDRGNYERRIENGGAEKNLALTMFVAGALIGFLLAFIVLIHFISKKKSGLKSLV